MLDREIVAGVARGNPGALAAAYDRYAGSLYGYCRSLLAEPADAADAVQHTFVIAAAKVSGLRERDRFRAWLFAVARNECHRQQRAGDSLVPLDEAAEMTDVADLGADAEQAELRDLVRAALSGLNPGEREIIELNLRHELAGDDLADVLGVPRNQAHALASRARSQFETSLGVLLVARSGREYCQALASILDGWDGELTVLIRKRVNRHIERCPVCGERKRRELSPAMLLGLLPVAMLPVGLREEAFRLVADVSPDAETYRAQVVGRAEPFDGTGFPTQFTSPPAPRWQGSYVLAAVAAVLALALLGAGSSLVLIVHGEPSVSAAQGAVPGSAGKGARHDGGSVSGSAPTPAPRPGFPAAPLISPVSAGSSRSPVPAARQSTTPAAGHSTTAVPSTSKSTTPAPSTSAPAPSTSAPAPSTSAPAPSTSAPAPSTSAPAPSTSAPAPSTSAPAPSTSAPAPSLSAA
jgi:RNA polymerase sigma factor (sigma-70 family)